MTEALGGHHSDIERRPMSHLLSWVMGKPARKRPVRRRPRKERHAPVAAKPAHYTVEHSGWSSVGWSEEDPTIDEAMAALKSLRRIDFTSAMEGLRKSAEVSLEKLDQDRPTDGQS
jgi:hypothetical protein